MMLVHCSKVSPFLLPLLPQNLYYKYSGANSCNILESEEKKDLGLVQDSVAYQPANRAFLPLARLLGSLSKGVFE